MVMRLVCRASAVKGGGDMNITVPFLVESPGEGLERAAPVQGSPVAYQMRAMSFVSIGATFRPEVVAAMLPRNLTACDGCSGGFLVALAREGHVLAPFSIGHVWFDVTGHDGTAGPGRYLPKHFGSSSGGVNAAGRASLSCCARITDCPDQVVAQLDRADAPALRLSVRSRSNWTSCAGIDYSITGGDIPRPATRLIITPWAAEWSDADPQTVEILSPEWADLRPVSLTWAAIGRQGAMTLGLSAPLST